MNFAILPFNKSTFVLLALLVCVVSDVFGQSLQVTGGNTPPYTPSNLISNVFLGDGVEVTNIQYSGSGQAVGYFSGGNAAIGIDRGIVLTTGLAVSNNSFVGAEQEGGDFASYDNLSNANDNDLADLTTSGLNNVAVYTITFVPTSDTLRFKYCFASEEYPEYGCSQYNDVFGFFIKGPGFPTYTNIAKIPGTNLPVAINNIHPVNPGDLTCQAAYLQYYNNNLSTNNQPTYDGFTDVFTAMAVVQPCQQYTIKLAIADVGDGIYDSGVFLEAKSFGTGSLRVEALTVSLDQTVTEGCSNGTLRFALPNAALQDYVIDYNIWGTAVNGLDYDSIPMDLIIPAGQKEVTVSIQAFEDLLAESAEYIAVDVQRDPCNRDTILVYIRDNTIVLPLLRPDTAVCVAGAAAITLNGTLPIPLPSPPSFSNVNDFAINQVNVPVFSPVNVFGVLPAKLEAGAIRSVCVNFTHPFDDDLDLFLVSPDGQFIELSTDNGGAGDNYTNTCFTPTANKKITFPGPIFAPASSTPFTGNYLPEGVWTDLYGNHKTNGTWKLQVIDDSNGFPGTLNDWTITFEPAYKINYQWSPSSAVSCDTCPITVATATTPQTYKIIATDSYGCQVSDSVSIDVEQTLAAPFVTCSDIGPNNITFVWDPVTNANTYEISVNGGTWSPASNEQYIVNSLTPGQDVTIEVRGVGGILGCPALVGAATCTTCNVPVVSVQTTPTACADSNDGAATLVPDGLNPPYSFSIGMINNTDGVFTGLAKGDYIATITDANGCQAFKSVKITAPEPIVVVTFGVDSIRCFGGNDGILTPILSGGTGTKTYLWSDPANQTTYKAINLSSGTYTVTVMDANGCTTTKSTNMPNPPAISLSIDVSNVKCYAGNTGTATAIASGGTGGFTWHWNNAQNNATAINLIANTYSVTATDANGCTKTATTVISQPDVLTATINAMGAACFGSNNGQASIFQVGGTAGYTYQWSTTPTQTTQTAINLPAQNYTATITDANGCTTTASAEVSQPNALIGSTTGTDALCNATATGEALSVATGGTSPYTYLWNDPNAQITPLATGLTSGEYTVTITDAHACTHTVMVSIGEPAALASVNTVVKTSCFGKADGSIQLAPQGGTAPYQYGWNTATSTTLTLANQIAGNYTATITDANGCTFVASETIEQPEEILLNISPLAVKCYGEQTGSINMTLTGGSPNYNIFWAGPNNYTGSGNTINALAAGQYATSVTDANGCQSFKTVQIEQPTNPLLTGLAEISDTICFGTNNGTAKAIPFGGTAPYTLQWSLPGQTEANISDLSVGYYWLTVTDANNCQKVDSTFIKQSQQIFVWLAPTSPRCHDGSDGKAIVQTVFYGATTANVNDFAYQWGTNPPQTGKEAVNLQALGTYSVTATDAAGCTATQEVMVGNTPILIAQILESANVLCHGGNTGWVSAKGVGGTGAYTYFWSNNAPVQIDSLAINLPAGLFKLTVTDANGCQSTSQIAITEPSALSVDFEKIDVLCFGESSGKVKAFPKGGVPNYQFLWENGSNTNEAKDVSTGFLTLQLTDKNGCQLTDSIAIGQPEKPLTGDVRKKDARCYRDHNGEIQIMPSGGVQPYKYSVDGKHWNGSPKQIGLEAGIYSPQIEDHNGCILELPSVQIFERSQLDVELGPDITITLGMQTQLHAVVTNAVGPIEYIWSSEDSIWLSCMDCPDPFVDLLYYVNGFELYIVDSMGCSAEDRIVVNVDKIRKVFVPTGFTPNGQDEALNETLKVHGEDRIKVLDFTVYDRWGEVLFKAKDFDINDPAFGWDGNFRGKPMDPGIYVWVVEVQYIDGVHEVFKGNTMLIR